MPLPAYFVQDCPTCGRALRVRVVLLGQMLTCEHCRGKFQATDPAMAARANSHSAPELIRRADELLASIKQVGH